MTNRRSDCNENVQNTADPTISHNLVGAKAVPITTAPSQLSRENLNAVVLASAQQAPRVSTINDNGSLICLEDVFDATIPSDEAADNVAAWSKFVECDATLYGDEKETALLKYLSSNTGKYTEEVTNTVAEFIRIIGSNPKLHHLVEMVSDGNETTFRFITMLRANGRDNHEHLRAKKRVLNSMLVVYIHQKRRKDVDDKDSPKALYSMSMYGKLLKHLFAFFWKAGVHIQQRDLVSFPGSYSTCITQLINNARFENPNLVNRTNVASVEIQDEEKIRKAITAHRFDPINNPEHLLWLVTYRLSRDLALRGGIEVSVSNLCPPSIAVQFSDVPLL